eukprot:TRINITY_DN302_c0_g2_i1.p1 TRINITY_DN302_c0_g2~~TRINITY_DN302_c0_g2_i1.p1  ORF type:complete len:125 (+),score=45.51 TRINITY_DN302_c0_g2_i1:114-488(+)
MRHIAAYLLAVLGGNSKPDVQTITNILASVEIEPDTDKIKKLIEELKGKDLEQVIAEGQAKLGAVPSGGGGGVAARGSAPAQAVTASAPSTASAPKEDSKPKDEEKEPKDDEESDEDMGFGLFD